MERSSGTLLKQDEVGGAQAVPKVRQGLRGVPQRTLWTPESGSLVAFG